MNSAIHKVAELKNVNFSDIDENYDSLEKEMLREFYVFVKKHLTYKWIHWNMRDINYGFEAIAHRAKVLGNRTITINDNDKYDLSRLLISKYGKQYAKHPRLQSILDMNNISSKNWLSGEYEAKAFNSKEFVRLHQSTLAKVDVLENILKLTAEDNFKHNAKLIEIYGLSPQGIFELSKDHWLYALFIVFISSIFGLFLSN